MKGMGFVNSIMNMFKARPLHTTVHVEPSKQQAVHVHKTSRVSAFLRMSGGVPGSIMFRGRNKRKGYNKHAA